MTTAYQTTVLNQPGEPIGERINELESIIWLMKQTRKYYQLNGWDKIVPIYDFVGKEKIGEKENELNELRNRWNYA